MTRSLAAIRALQSSILEGVDPQTLRALGVDFSKAEPVKPILLEIEQAILSAPLDGYDLADLAAAIAGKAKRLNEDFAFDVEPFRLALAKLED